MKLSKLLAVDKDVDITGIETDSRKVKKGNLFICLSGEKKDGHDFAKEAIANGAVAIVCERSLGIDGEILLHDTRRAAARLYSMWYRQPQKQLKIYGVTGTNGKTSVVSLLYAIYQRAGVKCAISGTLGSFWDGKAYEAENTTAMPEVLYKQMREMVDDGVEVLFMEVSSHALVGERVSEIDFQYAVYTNLTPEHLDYHKTMEQYGLAKEKLFEKTKVGIFNYDDLNSYHASQRCCCTAYGFGKREESDFRLERVLKQDLTGSTFLVRHQEACFQLTTSLTGEFNIYNILAAVSVSLLDGIDLETVREAVASFQGVKGRMEKIYSGLFSVIIDYAHTPDALERVLFTLRQSRCARLRVLFGCGGDRDKKKRPMMGAIAAKYADDVIVTGDNARSEDPMRIIQDILAGVDQKSANYFKVIENRRMALEYAIDTAMPGDVLLVAGKGHEEYEIDCSGKHSFSEREILFARLRKNGYLI